MGLWELARYPMPALLRSSSRDHVFNAKHLKHFAEWGEATCICFIHLTARGQPCETSAPGPQQGQEPQEALQAPNHITCYNLQTFQLQLKDFSSPFYSLRNPGEMLLLSAYKNCH